MSNVGNWRLENEENIFVGTFNNISDIEKYGAFPGKYGDCAATSSKENCEKFRETDFYEQDYSFYYKGNSYFYGIKKDNTEVVAIVTDNGKLIPVFAGAGEFNLKNNKGDEIVTNIAVKGFETLKNEKYDAIKVYYSAEGDFEYLKELSNTYVFRENDIDVEAYIYCEGIDQSSLVSDSRFKGIIFNTKCSFKRIRLNNCDCSKKRVAYYWRYPEDNDFVHKETDAVVFSDKFGDYALYTYVRDKNSLNQIKINRISSVNLPIDIPKDIENFEYRYNMSLVAVKNDNKATYHSYFKGKNMNFAAGVEAVENNLHSTFFIGRDLHLNLNVTNLSDSCINFNVKFNLIDYDGEVVLSEVHYNNKLSSGEEANRNIKLNLEKYGMYFLNLYVTDGENEYKECYPFAMIEDYSFKYRKENPFGIDAPHTDNNESVYLPIAELAGKLGISSIRIDRQYDNFALSDLLKEKGVTRQLIGIPVNNDSDKIENYVETVKDVAAKWKDRAEILLLSNEADKYCKANYDKSVKYINETFYPNSFKPAFDFLSKNYPEKLDNVVWESNCHGSTEWLEAFYEAGLWDKSGIIDIHSYSSPTGPDKCFSNQMSSMFASLFSNEYAVVRWKRICRRYGKKRLMFGETGYPSNPHNKCEIDNRTVADFNTRIALLFLEAGAEMINYYCLFDRTSFLVGTGSWNENYFGACYYSDLYGRFMPKPWAAALANLTRRLDGVEKCDFFNKYEEDEYGTLRAFKVNKKDGSEFAVVWSNIYIQPNTDAYGRVNKLARLPMPQWQSRWLESETRSFDAVGDEVTVVDIMGNSKTYKTVDGKVELNITGSPIFVYGIC